MIKLNEEKDQKTFEELIGSLKSIEYQGDVLNTWYAIGAWRERLEKRDFEKVKAAQATIAAAMILLFESTAPSDAMEIFQKLTEFVNTEQTRGAVNFAKMARSGLELYMGVLCSSVHLINEEFPPEINSDELVKKTICMVVQMIVKLMLNNVAKNELRLEFGSFIAMIVPRADIKSFDEAIKRVDLQIN